MRMTPAIALAPPLTALLQDGQVRGYCTNRQDEAVILEYGLADRHVFMRGRGAEDLGACLSSYRGRPGWLVLNQDLRAFGGTKRLVAQHSGAMEKARIRILDLSHPEDTTYSAMIQRASVVISGARFTDRRRARRQGRAGGLRKGVAARDARDAMAGRWLVDNIVDHDLVPWDVKLQLLQPHFSESTLRRHYGAVARNRRA